jgi:hypothetical protein
MKKSFFTVCIAVCCIANASAQFPKAPENLPSPTAWKFSQYGDIPVSQFNGSAQLSVPILDFQYQGQKNNIELSYYNTGFKPDAHPGWVGEGWNINVGGVITREVKGLPDEFLFYFMDYTTVPASRVEYNTGFIRTNENVYNEDINCRQGYTFVLFDGLATTFVRYPYPVPYTNAPSGCTYGHNINGCGTGALIASNLTPGVLDNQRDEFSFNFFGYSGKFYFNSEGNIVVKSNSNLKVQKHSGYYDIPLELKPPFNPPGGGDCYNFLANTSPWEVLADNPQTINAFDIITEDGTVFTFGKTPELLNGSSTIDYSALAIEYSSTPALTGTGALGARSKGAYWIADAWYLTRVKFPNNKIIDYRYQRRNFILNPSKSMYAYKVVSTPGACTPPAAQTVLLGEAGWGRSVSPVYLSSINSELLQANFFISPTTELRTAAVNIPQPSSANFDSYGYRWYKLDSFNIGTYQSAYTKIKMVYSNSTTQRLRLLKIIIDPDGAPETTEFEYENSLTEPGYQADQTDHFGYWNGVTASYPFSLQNFSGKDPDFQYAKQGMLKKVIYPTGGRSEFEYEPNTYSKKVKSDRTLGIDNVSNTTAPGVRVKKITSFDAATNITQVKEYLYVIGYDNTLTQTQLNALSSSGVLGVSGHQYYWDGVYGFQTPNYTCTPALIRVFSNSPLGVNADAGVTYSEVIEKLSDNSYSKYKFSNHDNGYVDEPMVTNHFAFSTPYFHYSSRSDERGKLLELLHYNANNVLVQKTKYTYSRVPSINPVQEIQRLDAQLFDDASYRTDMFVVTQGVPPQDWIVGNTYKQFLNRFLQTKQEIITYDPDGSNPLTTVVENFYENSQHGQLTKTITTNSKGEVITSVLKYAHDFTGNTALNLMKTRNYLNKIIEQYSTITKQGSEYVTASKLNEFSILNSNDVVFDRQFNLDLAKPLLKSSWTATAPGSYDFGQSSNWTRSSAYNNTLSVKKYDDAKNPIYVTSNNGLHYFSSYDISGTKLTSLLKTGSYNFGNFCYSGFEGDAHKMFDIISGNYNWGNGFTGSASFNGVIRTKDFIHTSTIYLVAKTSGPVPLLEIVQGNVTAGPAFQAVGQKGDWTIYKVSYSSFGSKAQINTNGNSVDEVRFIPSNGNWDMQTYVYSNNLLSATVDNNFVRTYYEYDSRGRLHLVRDENNNIIKKICYNFHDQPEDCSVGNTPTGSSPGRYVASPVLKT